MITFVEYLEETVSQRKTSSRPRTNNTIKYPYKLNRWKKGQKRRSISMSNAYYIGQKDLKKKIAATKKRNRQMYKKKTKR